MSESGNHLSGRRLFLKFLAGSPLLMTGGFPIGRLGKLAAPRTAAGAHGASLGGLGAQEGEVIASETEAINVFDFEAVARKKLPPAHYGYLATGVDDDRTLRANREGFQRYQLRMRRLVDVRKIDMSTKIFGAKWGSPIILAPAGSQRAFHPEGEMAVARAAAAKGHLQILSTVTTSSVEDVTAARGAPIWYQLYTTDDWSVTRAIVKRAEAAGCPVLVLTVDLQGGTNRESFLRSRKRDKRRCSACHEEGISGRVRRKPMFDGLDLSRVTDLVMPGMTWDFIRRLRDLTPMKIVVKGIVTREDAELCVEYGADGIIVSNHGGRAESSDRSTIESLPEIIEGVGRRVPVLIDSGFRRGTDIFKALALGARAICIGRPYLWGLAAFGQAGVEAVLNILRRELHLTMRQAGTRSIDEISRSFVVNHSG